MPVRDLVKQFESSSPVRAEGQTRLSPGARRNSASPESGPSEGPPPSPARFIHHPLLQRRSLPPQLTTKTYSRPPAVDAAQNAEESSNIHPSQVGANSRINLQQTEHFSGQTNAIDRQRNSSSPRAANQDKISAPNAASPQRASEPPSPPRNAEGSTHVVANETHGRRSGRLGVSRLLNTVDSPILRGKASASSGPGIGSGDSMGEAKLGGRQNHSPQAESMPMTAISTRRSRLSGKHDLPFVTAHSAFQEGSSSNTTVVSPRPQAGRTKSSELPIATLSRDVHDRHDLHDLTTSRTPSPSTTLVPHHTFPHVPIAARTVFSRGSAPLLLPPLDNYLASIPPPNFSFSSDSRSSNARTFPLLDRLAVTGRTIEDLENNAALDPPWRRRGTIFGSLVNLVIGAMGSSAIASYYSLQGLYDGLQVFALLLSTIVPKAVNGIEDKWRKLFLGTIPNILALNFSTILLESFIFLIVLMILSGLLLYYVHISTTRIARDSSREGLQDKDAGAGWGLIFATFTLTLIYLPLSTIAVHALLWSQDFWVVPNPYINSTSFPPDLPPLGPPSQFRDPLDFCYTTTMRRNDINFAPLLVVLSGLTFIFLTIWFPLRLAKVIIRAVPRVDRYTELGEPRSKIEMDHEYERLLDRDNNAFNFLYKDLRRQWGMYKAIYLFVKLSTLLIVAFLDPYNCAFRNVRAKPISIARETILVLVMLGFLLLQCFLAPFLDPVNNASEWVSRAGYVAFSLVGLGTALDLPINARNAVNGPILYIIYAINYGLTFYFLVINLSWSRRLVKKLFRRIDFSIDIFSPHLDISSNSRHTRRRIWQETISILLLTSPDCAIPKSQRMAYSESPDSQWPPYLLDFQGTPAERHVENLKILREVGGLSYAKGIALHTGRCSERMKRVQERIQQHFIGPDSYWRPSSRSGDSDSCFGNAWWIPFPPTLVIHYDSGQVSVLDKLQELEEYVHQNEDEAVREKREIRLALRALDGLVVVWPYTHIQLIGSHSSLFWGKRYTAQTATDYKSCVFSIVRRGSLAWKGMQLGSGFDVQLTYARDVQVDGDVIGLGTDFDMTPQLANFLSLNTERINLHLYRIDEIIGDYRRQMRREMRAKYNALSYEFLCTVYGSPKDPDQLAKVIAKQEKDLRARQASVENEEALKIAYERMKAVSRSEATAWWYLYWDDLWRRNYDTISALRTYEADFNPHYPTSIAYNPLPRAALEALLSQRGLYHSNGSRSDFIHSGILNKLYFRLNQIVFHGSEEEILVHIGGGSLEVDIENLEFSSHPRTSTLGTGGGTDHDDYSIRARPFYRWEAIYEDPLHYGAGGRQKRWLPKLAVWFGLSPFWKSAKSLTNGLSLDVRLEDGKYVLLENAVDEFKDKVD